MFDFIQKLKQLERQKTLLGIEYQNASTEKRERLYKEIQNIFSKQYEVENQLKK